LAGSSAALSEAEFFMAEDIFFGCRLLHPKASRTKPVTAVSKSLSFIFNILTTVQKSHKAAAAPPAQERKRVCENARLRIETHGSVVNGFMRGAIAHTKNSGALDESNTRKGCPSIPAGS
jgi:hypothetical protein